MSFTLQVPDHTDKPAAYAALADQAQALLADERDRVANAANLAALIWYGVPDLNWAGFYFAAHGSNGPELVLGPFQGKPACIRIPFGRGVCGIAAAMRSTQLVADVHTFAGHIACDPASRSEIVVPLLSGSTLLGVLDLDSPRPARFDLQDRDGLERLAAIWVSAVAAE